MTSGSALSAPGRLPLTPHRPATSAGNATRYPPLRRWAPTGARRAPRWPRAPEPVRPRARAGFASAHRGRAHPLTRPRGPRGCHPPVDPRAPAGPHIGQAPVARVRALSPACRRALQSPQHHASPRGERAGAHQGLPRSTGAAIRGLVAYVVTDAHEAHAAAQHDPRAARGPSAARPRFRPSAP